MDLIKNLLFYCITVPLFILGMLVMIYGVGRLFIKVADFNKK